MHLKFLLIFTQFLFIFTQKNPNFVQNRSVIVHLNEWKWTDIAQECERFFQLSTFAGIQISPPNENVIISGRPWYERYQPVSYNLTTRSGTEEEFANMTLRCNNVGIRIYADVILNHMAGVTGVGTGGNEALSDVKMYPGVPYQPQDFHPTCNISDYLNPDVVRDCELKNNKDLNQAKSNVQNNLVAYLNRLIELGVAGFRIDSAKYVSPKDLQNIYGKLNNLNTKYQFSANSKAFLYQDVPVFDNDVVGTDEYTSMGTVLEFKHSTEISKTFKGIFTLANLTIWGPERGFIPESSDAVVFVDNHSNQRDDQILTYKDLRQYKMALSFMLAHTYGIPKMISSYFFNNKDIGPPMDSSENIKSPVINSDGSCGNGYVCEHRWPQIINMVDFRNVVDGTNIENWWSDGDQQIAFSRGNKGFIAFSNDGNLTENIQTSLPSGTYCDVISGKMDNKKCTGKSVIVDTKGFASVKILETDYDGVVAIHVNNKL